jgi:hypothetical protein
VRGISPGPCGSDAWSARTRVVTGRPGGAGGARSRAGRTGQ